MNKKELEKREREQKELERREREQKELEKREREQKALEQKKASASKQAPPFLPPPVPTEATEGYENIVADENDNEDANPTIINNTSTVQKLMPIVGIILVGIIMWALLRGCQDDSDTKPMVENPPTKTDTKSVTKTATSIEISTDSSGKLDNVEVITNDTNSADKIEKVLKDNFEGFEKKDDNIQTDKERKGLLINDETLAELLTLIKHEPDTSMSIIGEEIKFINKDEEKRQKFITEAQKILSEFNSNADDKKIQELTVNGKVVKLDEDDGKPTELNIDEEVENSITASKKALHNLNGKPNVKAIEDALNTQIFNFAVNDNQIPKENKPILNKASELLKKTNTKIKIIGHTDSDGDEQYNKRLSEDRSYAVKKYLMIQGLPSSSIKAEGAGESKPIDSNDTEIGKFHNRRIEFEIKEVSAD
ncbi:MAG: OmpA family protein [Moraxellaceae bacterium]|nr:OmpA family protein [Moraxellaceae bacterium]